MLKTISFEAYGVLNLLNDLRPLVSYLFRFHFSYYRELFRLHLGQRQLSQKDTFFPPSKL